MVLYIRYQKLSENFIREFQDKVNWYNISIIKNYQKISSIEFKDKVNWNDISKYQKLSENFIREFQNKVNWCEYIIYQNYQKTL